MKRPAMTRTLIRRIGQYKQKNPKDTIKEIARLFDVSYQQAYDAVKKFNDPSWWKSPKRRSVKKPLTIAAENTDDQLLSEEYTYALAQISSDKTMQVHDRVKLLESLTFIRKTRQQLELQQHMKRVDADVVATIVRMFQPEATDEEVIKIYLEAQRRVQS